MYQKKRRTKTRANELAHVRTMKRTKDTRPWSLLTEVRLKSCWKPWKHHKETVSNHSRSFGRSWSDNRKHEDSRTYEIRPRPIDFDQFQFQPIRFRPRNTKKRKGDKRGRKTSVNATFRSDLKNWNFSILTCFRVTNLLDANSSTIHTDFTESDKSSTISRFFVHSFFLFLFSFPLCLSFSLSYWVHLTSDAYNIVANSWSRQSRSIRETFFVLSFLRNDVLFWNSKRKLNAGSLRCGMKRSRTTLVSKELKKHPILNSNRLRTFEDVRPKVTDVETVWFKIRDFMSCDTGFLRTLRCWSILLSFDSRTKRVIRFVCGKYLKYDDGHFQQYCSTSKNASTQHFGLSN